MADYPTEWYDYVCAYTTHYRNHTLKIDDKEDCYVLFVIDQKGRILNQQRFREGLLSEIKTESYQHADRMIAVAEEALPWEPGNFIFYKAMVNGRRTSIDIEHFRWWIDTADGNNHEAQGRASSLQEAKESIREYCTPGNDLYHHLLHKE